MASLTLNQTNIFVLFWNLEYLHPKESYVIYPEVICQRTDPLHPLPLGLGKQEREAICLLDSDSVCASCTHNMGHLLPLTIRQDRSRCWRALLHNWSHYITKLISSLDPGPGLYFDMVKTHWPVRSDLWDQTKHSGGERGNDPQKPPDDCILPFHIPWRMVNSTPTSRQSQMAPGFVTQQWIPLGNITTRDLNIWQVSRHHSSDMTTVAPTQRKACDWVEERWFCQVSDIWELPQGKGFPR